MTSPLNQQAPILTIANLIGGQEKPSFENDFFESQSSDGQVSRVASSGLMDVVLAIQAMHQAQSLRGKVSAESRRRQVEQLLPFFMAELEREKENLSSLLASELGVPVATTLARNLPAALKFLEESQKFIEGEILSDSYLLPSVGACAVFLGASDPVLSFCRRVPLILLSGSSVCLKPSSRAARSYKFISDLFVRALKKSDTDVGLFSVLFGQSAGPSEAQTAPDALLRHPGFKTIFWLGSSAAALEAQKIAVQFEKRFHFVGSGRNPAMIFSGFSDADLELKLKVLAESAMDFHGLGPYRPSRFFVQESIYKETVGAFAEILKNLTTGDPKEPRTQIGSATQKDCDRFVHQIQLALSETGHLVTGGERKGARLQPTLVRDLTNCSTLQSEELAGPWATIASFKYAHEALKYANTSPLGLAGYVLHPDSAKAMSVASKLETSRVFLSQKIDWPGAVIRRVAAVKQSGSHDDGIEPVFRFCQWRPEIF